MAATPLTHTIRDTPPPTSCRPPLTSSAAMPKSNADINYGANLIMDYEDLKIGVMPIRQTARRRDDVSLDSLVSEIELYKYLHASADIRDFSNRITSLLRPIGITDFCHHAINAISGALDSFGTYPSKLMDEYAREGFHQDDLMLRHAWSTRSVDSHLFQDQVNKFVEDAPCENELFKQNREIAKFMQHYKMLDAYNVIILQGTYRAFLGVSSHNCPPKQFQQIVTANFPNLQILGNAVDSVGRTKFKSHFHNEKYNPRIPINSKPLQLLAVLKKDLTLNEAAEVLNISISTANQQIAAAKKALGTHTTHGTVIAAIKEGLIDP
jgi:hypothetical protein